MALRGRRMEKGLLLLAGARGGGGAAPRQSPLRPAGRDPHETQRWGYFLRTKPSNEDYFFERRKFLNCLNAFAVAILLQQL